VININIEQVNSFNYLGNMISYEKELDINNKWHNYLKTTGILNNVFRRQKFLKKTRIKLKSTLGLPVLFYGIETWTIKAPEHQKNNSNRDEIHENYSRIHLDRLQNKYINCKEINNNNNFGQITGIQEKMDTICK